MAEANLIDDAQSALCADFACIEWDFNPTRACGTTNGLPIMARISRLRSCPHRAREISLIHKDPGRTKILIVTEATDKVELYLAEVAN